MRYLALATDYDGTLAHHGVVAPATLQAVERLRDSGRKLILVTGRRLEELLPHVPQPEIFDRIVAENGAVLYRPDVREEQILAKPPAPQFVQSLRDRGVRDLAVGRVIVATQTPYENVVLLAIRDLGLELQVTFNKGAVMVLPSGVNKATGLQAALAALKLSPHNVVGVGDAENDHAFLEICECAAAVANALPAICAKADLVLSQPHGLGVTELITEIVTSDLAKVSMHLGRHGVPLGRLRDDGEFRLFPFGSNVLVAGTSGAGKSTLVGGLIERFVRHQYQALIIDPEGDYPEIEGALVLGTAQQAASVDEIVGALDKPARTVIANLISIPLEDRPEFLQSLLYRLMSLQSRTGRPHWIVLDEAHHLFPVDRKKEPIAIPANLPPLILATVDPQHVDPDVLQRMGMIVAVGKSPVATIGNYCRVAGLPPPRVEPGDLVQGQAMAWRPGGSPMVFETLPMKSTRRRHVRKYARGELNEADSFYFEGRDKKLRLRAQNLQAFLQLATGVDDETWLFHLHSGDYSRWIKRVVKDADLGAAVEQIENGPRASANATRRAIRAEIEARYTAAE